MKKTLLNIFLILATLFIYSCDDNKDEATILNLNESAKVKTLADQYQATLDYQATSNNRAKLQNEINKMMQKATNQIKDEDLKISTGRYYVRKNWHHKTKNQFKWFGSQQIKINSHDKKKLLNATAQLQKLEFTTKNLNSYLSDEKKDSYHNQLVKQALEKIKDQAQIIGESLDKDDVHIKEIRVNRSNNFQHNRLNHANSMKSESIATPVIKEHEQTISVNISATISLED